MQAGFLETHGYQGQTPGTDARARVKPAIDFLDSSLPLLDASHNDVVGYSVETIWRKAECFATLASGHKARLRDGWQFIGYTGRNPVRFLLFRHQGVHIEMRIDSDAPIVAVHKERPADWLRRLSGQLPEMLARAVSGYRDRTYITVDGEQFTLRGAAIC